MIGRGGPRLWAARGMVCGAERSLRSASWPKAEQLCFSPRFIDDAVPPPPTPADDSSALFQRYRSAQVRQADCFMRK